MTANSLPRARALSEDIRTWKTLLFLEMPEPRPTMDEWMAASDRLVDALDSEGRHNDVTLLERVKVIVHVGGVSSPPLVSGALHNQDTAWQRWETDQRTIREADGALNRLARRSEPKHSSPLPKKRVSVSEAHETMTKTITLSHDTMAWSTHKWAEHIGCSSQTVWKTQMWKKLEITRERMKAERKEQYRGRRRAQHQSKY